MGSTPSKTGPESTKQPKRLRPNRTFRRSAQSEVSIAQNPQQWSYEQQGSQKQDEQRPSTDQCGVAPEDGTVDHSPMNDYNHQDINRTRRRFSNSPHPESISNNSHTSKSKVRTNKSVSKNGTNQDVPSSPRASTSGNRSSFSLLRSVGSGRRSSQLQRLGERDSLLSQEQHGHHLFHFSAGQPFQISAPIIESESPITDDTIWTDEQRYVVDSSRGVRHPPRDNINNSLIKSTSIPSTPRASADDANYHPVTEDNNVRRRPDQYDRQNNVASPRSGAYKAPAPPLPISAQLANVSTERLDSDTTTGKRTEAGASPKQSWRENNILSNSLSDGNAQGSGKPSSPLSQYESLPQSGFGSDQSGSNNDNSDAPQVRAFSPPAAASTSTSARTSRSSRSKRNCLHEDWLLPPPTTGGYRRRRLFNFQERLLQQPASDNASIISLAGSRTVRGDGSSTAASSVHSSMRSSAITGYDEESHPSESEDLVSDLPAPAEASQAAQSSSLDHQQQPQQQRRRSSSAMKPSRPHSMSERDLRRLSNQPPILPKNAKRWSQSSAHAIQPETSNSDSRRLSGSTPPRSPARRNFRSSDMSTSTATASSSSKRNSNMSSLQSPLSSRSSPRTSQEPPPRLPAGVMSHEQQVRQHLALNSILGANYQASINTKDLGAVLDVGCGSGQWVKEMAQEFPMTEIHGVDLLIPTRQRRVARFLRTHLTSSTTSVGQPSQLGKSDQHASIQSASSSGSWTYSSPALGSGDPTMNNNDNSRSDSCTAPNAQVDEPFSLPGIVDSMPSNCFFHKADITLGLPFADNTFDFCHVRLVLWGYRLNSFPELLNELIRVTKPSGWIEFVDMDPCIRMPSELGTRLNEWIKTGLIHSNMDPDLVRALPEYLEAYCEQSRKELETLLASSNLVASSASENSSSLSHKTGGKRFKRGGGIKAGNNDYGLSQLKISRVSVPIGAWGGRKGELWLETFIDFLRCLEPMMTDAAMSGLVMDHLHKQVQQRLSTLISESTPITTHSSPLTAAESQKQKLEDLKTNTEETWRTMIDQLAQEASATATATYTEKSGAPSAATSWNRDAPRSYTSFYLAQVQKVNLLELQQQELLKELEKEILSPTLSQGVPNGQPIGVDSNATLTYHEHQRKHHLRHLSSLEEAATSPKEIISPRALPAVSSITGAPLNAMPFTEGILTGSIQLPGSGVSNSNIPSAPPAPASVAALSIRTNSRASNRESSMTSPQQSSDQQQKKSPLSPPPPPTRSSSGSGFPSPIMIERSVSRSSSLGSMTRSSGLPLARRIGTPRRQSPGISSAVPLPPVPTSPIPPIPVASAGSTPPPIGHAVKRKPSQLSNIITAPERAADAASVGIAGTISPTESGKRISSDSPASCAGSPASAIPEEKGYPEEEEEKREMEQDDESSKEEILIALSDEPADDDGADQDCQHGNVDTEKTHTQQVAQHDSQDLSSDIETEGEEIHMLLVEDDVESPYVPHQALSQDAENMTSEGAARASDIKPAEEPLHRDGEESTSMQERSEIDGEEAIALLAPAKEEMVEKEVEQVQGSEEGIAAQGSPRTPAADNDSGVKPASAANSDSSSNSSSKRSFSLKVDTVEANKYYSSEQERQRQHDSSSATTTFETPTTTASPVTPLSAVMSQHSSEDDEERGLDDGGDDEEHDNSDPFEGGKESASVSKTPANPNTQKNNKPKMKKGDKKGEPKSRF